MQSWPSGFALFLNLLFVGLHFPFFSKERVAWRGSYSSPSTAFLAASPGFMSDTSMHRPTCCWANLVVPSCASWRVYLWCLSSIPFSAMPRCLTFLDSSHLQCFSHSLLYSVAAPVTSLGRSVAVTRLWGIGIVVNLASATWFSTLPSVTHQLHFQLKQFPY